MRERGLKQLISTEISPDRIVAPHAGAWIETKGKLLMGKGEKVAPHAGAWIETNKPCFSHLN